MKKFYILFLLGVLLPVNILTAQDNIKWNVEKSTHFIVSYKKADADFIRRLISYAEDYYNKIADELGFRRYDFWLWDNRAKIYIYDDSKDYLSSTGQPAWSSGYANVREKMISTYPYAEGFFETILPHEMGHIIFREFVGFYNTAVPVWLDEGVASYQENGRYEKAYRVIKNAIEGGSFIPLEELSGLSPQFLLDREAVNLFYSEAVGIIHYLIKEFGKDNFVALCQRLRDKGNLEEAVRSSYPFKNIQELGKRWEEYLRSH
ncbi:MAG: peptidase MA family metallohydrolase [Candidatus Omnitrophota bacterium]